MFLEMPFFSEIDLLKTFGFLLIDPSEEFGRVDVMNARKSTRFHNFLCSGNGFGMEAGHSYSFI
jgi:hypothetical protein